MGRPSFPRTLLVLTVFLVLGGPLAYALWHELSVLLYGHVHEAHLGLLAVAVVLMAILVRVLGRYVWSLGDAEEGA